VEAHAYNRCYAPLRPFSPSLPPTSTMLPRLGQRTRLISKSRQLLIFSNAFNLSRTSARTFSLNAPVAAVNKHSFFASLDTFPDRHIGPNNDEVHKMLESMGYSSMEEFIKETVPPAIRLSSETLTDNTITPLSESELFRRAKQVGSKNKVMRSYIGMGYHNAVVPPVILRNVSPSCSP